MDLERLRPIVGNPSWHFFEDYLKEQRQSYMTRLVAETDADAANIQRGRIKQLDIVLNLPSLILKKPKN